MIVGIVCVLVLAFVFSRRERPNVWEAHANDGIELGRHE